jgi:hypothetical protein
MAYKFQRGDFVASGSITIEEELTGSGNVLLGQLANSSSIRGVLDLEDADGASYGLELGGTLVTSTAAELNLLDGAAAGKKVASKAAIYSSSGSLNTWGLAVVDGAYNLTVASHDGSSNGLVLGSTLVTATAAELNYLDITAAGAAEASKALVLDSARAINNILNLTASYISASYFFGDGSNLTGITSGGSGSALTRGYLWVGDGDNTAMAFDAATDGQILVGDGTDLLSVAISGDLSLSSDGDMEIGNNKLIQRMFGTGSANANVYKTGSVEANHIKQGAVTMAAMATGSLQNNAYATGSIRTNHIKQGAITMAAMATGSLENNAYATGSVQNAHLAGGITGAKMNNAIFADLEIGAPSADGEMIVATGAGAFQYESGATLRTSLGLGTGDSPEFDDLTVVDLTATGNVTLGDSGADTIQIEGFAKIESGISYSVAFKNENYTVAAGDYMINARAGNTLTLPAGASIEDGTVFVIKNGAGDASVASPVTIDGNGSETIDGDITIYLESPYASVNLMSSGSGWLAF